ncbi:MAG TPA: DUF4097 family beta strand repeat-containing protein [Spirochaetales bacterium]|nr:DUF4097 family beta strand repeat-containing protein [Spirochaetales bacterium]
MSRDEDAVEPGYFTEEIDPGEVERLVLRFPAGDIVLLPASPSAGGRIRADLELRGPAPALPGWKPSVRRSEGILVLADEGRSGVRVSEARIQVPLSFRDVEAHSGSGSIEARGIGADLLATTESGDIRVSGGAMVELSSEGGGIEAEGSTGLTARVGAGSLRCRGIDGPVSVESDSGDVTVESVSGNVIIISASGDVAVQKPGGRLRISSGSGDVELELAGRFAGGEVSTSSGDVSLALSGADLELRAETLSGGLEAPGVEAALSSGPRRFALRLGAGGRRLHIRSVSGDVEIDC